MNRGVRGHKAPTQGWQVAPSAPQSSCFGELKLWVIWIEGTVSIYPTKEIVIELSLTDVQKQGVPTLCRELGRRPSTLGERQQGPAALPYMVVGVVVAKFSGPSLSVVVSKST